MEFFFGLIIGSIISSVSFGMLSYYFWEKHTQDNHTGKKIFFSSFCFFTAGLTGILGGFPLLVISYAMARSYKSSKIIESPIQSDIEKVA